MLRASCWNQEGQSHRALNDVVTEASAGHMAKAGSTEFRVQKNHEEADGETGDAGVQLAEQGTITAVLSCRCPARSLKRLADAGSHWGSWQQSSSIFSSPAGRPKRENDNTMVGFRCCSTHSHQVGVDP